MNRKRLWLMTIATLLFSTLRVSGENLPIFLTEEDGLLSTTSHSEFGTIQYVYTSPVYTLDEATNVLYLHFLKGDTSYSTPFDRNGYPYVSLAEFYLYDGQGNQIALSESNFSTNAQEATEGPIAHICDGDRETFWHSEWSGFGASDFHHLKITLPEGQALSDFQFRYITRYTEHGNPSGILISSTSEIPPYEFSGTFDDITWRINLDQRELVIEGTGPMKDVIPWSGFCIESVTISEDITTIGAGAFRNCYKLKSITIPESVTSIGERAFFGCSSLTSITIPESVTSIGERAFWSCSLASVTIPEGVTSIEEGTFEGCIHLTSITIPEGVTSIGERAFGGCALPSITIPEGVTSIGSEAFAYSSLTSITIPESVTSIGQAAFYECQDLTSITIPKGVTSIGIRAFFGCNSLKELTFEDGNNVLTFAKDDPQEFFELCPLESIYLGRNLDYLSSPFHGTNTLTSVVIGDSVINIEDEAFCECYQLSSVVLGDNVTSIGYEAFYECYQLDSVTFGDNLEEVGTHAFHETAWFEEQPDGIVYIKDILYTYKGAMPENTSIEVKDGTKSISYSAFSGCSGLTSITIPESVTNIYNTAFGDCNNLTSINIPGGVTSIGNCTFENCSSLTSVTIPEGVTSIGEWAFGGCSSLTTITIPENVKTIERSAFENCSSLTTITIPENVKTIERSAFENCSSLTSVTISEGVTSIGSDAFGGCVSLTTITLPKSLTSIESYAFYNCKGLTAVDIPEGVTSIGSHAFQNCSGLTAMNIPEGVMSIGDYAFDRCTGELTVNCNIPSPELKDKTLGKFYGSRFTKVTLGDKVTSIGDYAFYNCKDITSITLPASITSIGSGALDTGGTVRNGANLKSVISLSLVPPTIESDTFYQYFYKKSTVTVPAKAVEAYQAAPYWKDFTIIGDETLTGIETLHDAAEVVGIYTIEGKRIEQYQHGINIVRMSDGTVQKVYVE